VLDEADLLLSCVTRKHTHTHLSFTNFNHANVTPSCAGTATKPTCKPSRAACPPCATPYSCLQR
jgi:hypothetical protein